MSAERPIYETDADRDRELATITAVADRLGLEVKTMPRRYPVDFMLTKGKGARYFAEVKCRKCERQTYPTFMLGLAKYIGMITLQEQTGVPTIIVVGWKDLIGMLRLPVPNLRIEVGGRTDRGDAQDVEPVVQIPTDLFQRVK